MPKIKGRTVGHCISIRVLRHYLRGLCFNIHVFLIWKTDHDFSTLPDILDVLEKKLTGPDMAVEVDQNAVVVKALTIYKDPKFDMTRPFKVSFNNQPALDVGGPKRDFFFQFSLRN